MDSFFWGKRGSGKTLGAIIRLWLDYLDGREIWSNIDLHSSLHAKKITVLDLIELLMDKEKFEALDNKPKTLLMDEMKGQANARLSSTFINRNVGHFVSQARKRNFKLIYTDQILSSYDKWIREMTDRIIRCVPVINPNDIGMGTTEYPEPTAFSYIEFDTYDWRIVNRYTIPRKVGRFFYPLYDTLQIVTPAELMFGEGESTE